MKKRRILVPALFCAVFAIGLILYPLIGNLMSEKHHSDLETFYTESLDIVADNEIQAAYDAAIAYNSMLAEGISSAPPVAYSNLLNVTTDGIMGYIQIPKLRVELPICHGTDAETLEYAVGHVVGTSLPIGGKDTHAVLSAHSGMAVSTLFSDLDKLAEGDTFYIHVLDQVLAYEVDQIAVVEPDDTTPLMIEKDADYVTLVTCTPFGVNTHRLLVRGHRVEQISLLVTGENSSAAVMSTWMQHYLTGLGISLGLLLLLLGGFYLIKRRNLCDE